MSAEVISRALDKYSRHVERTTRKILHRLHLDETRRSMYGELREDYDKHLASAKAFGIGTASAISLLMVHTSSSRCDSRMRVTRHPRRCLMYDQSPVMQIPCLKASVQAQESVLLQTSLDGCTCTMPTYRSRNSTLMPWNPWAGAVRPVALGQLLKVCTLLPASVTTEETIPC